jgi:queuine tRNA-ribosyltransferase
VRLQEEIGADVIMALDECLPYPVERDRAEESLRRTLRWARICRDSRSRSDQALFGIVQGATYRDLRLKCAGELASLSLDGYAVGGLSVGEGPELYREVLSYTVGALPEDRPRYLMGVGPPGDILDAVALGVDMFDCVLPTRNARSGWAFTRDGVLRLRNSRWRNDNRPISPECRCYACANFSRGYIRHLLCAGEATGGALVTIHNLAFYADMMAGIRDAVASGEFLCYAEDFRARMGRGSS